MRGRRALMKLLILPLQLFLVVVGSLGCSPSTPNNPPPPAPVCIDAGSVPSNCAPAYAANYDTIYANTLQPTCAKEGVSCHGGRGQQGGINFDNPDNAYNALTSLNKVRAGEPECSVLVQRVVATDGKVRMPPGRQLDAGEECAIIQWVAAGAHR